MRPDAAASDAENQSTKQDDPRLLRSGAFLRRWNLDELPQYWNVLRGDMSLVGPRPEVPCYVAGYTPAQRRVLRVRPGITDPASLDMSVLGRDILNLFAVIVDRPQDVVCLLTQDHVYEIRPR